VVAGKQVNIGWKHEGCERQQCKTPASGLFGFHWPQRDLHSQIWLPVLWSIKLKRLCQSA